MLVDPAVHEQIARTRIEPRHAAVGFQNTDITDATDIGHHPGFGVAAKYGLMKGRHQRGALATGGHVSAAKIGNHINTGQLGQQRRIIDLARVTAGGQMANRLSVRADRPNLCSTDVGGVEQRVHAGCVKGNERVGSHRFPVNFIGTGGLQGHQLVL